MSQLVFDQPTGPDRHGTVFAPGSFVGAGLIGSVDADRVVTLFESLPIRDDQVEAAIEVLDAEVVDGVRHVKRFRFREVSVSMGYRVEGE